MNCAAPQGGVCSSAERHSPAFDNRPESEVGKVRVNTAPQDVKRLPIASVYSTVRRKTIVHFDAIQRVADFLADVGFSSVGISKASSQGLPIHAIFQHRLGLRDFLRPADYYRGNPEELRQARRAKLAEARHHRKEKNLELRQLTLPLTREEIVA